MLTFPVPTALPMPDCLPHTILVVDDEPDVLTILHRVLRDLRHNHALVAVSMSTAAVELLALCSISLLITDYNMPGMNGLQLIQTVKRASPHTRTVLLTAYDTPDLRQRLRTCPVDYYLPKPFPLERLEQIVQETLH